MAAAARWIGSWFGDLAVLDFLPIGVNALMHIGHELVEMDAALAHHRTGLEEQVHQHGLAAADLAVDVKPFQRRGLFALAEQPAERGRFLRQPMPIEAPLELRQMLRQHRLAGIGLDFSGGNERRVARAEDFGHAAYDIGDKASDVSPERRSGGHLG